MAYVLGAVILLAGPGGIASLRARIEVPSQGRVSTATLLLLLAAFFGSGACAVLAARAGSWTLPFSANASRLAGGLIGFLGIALILASRLYFTFRQAWGLDFDKLITRGVYRWSRNPQVVGWFLTYVGVAVFGRSGAALLIAVLLLLAFVPWILAEERALERRFGDEYRRYCSQTRRFL
jgi:protein-S-isoprenylcysteine O-methyltransferase Ste14